MKKFVKITKICLINICLFALLFLVSEVLSVAVLYKEWSFLNLDFSKKTVQKFFLLKKGIYEEVFDYRPTEYKKRSRKKPIVLFGCSFVYGHGLSEDELFSRQLSDYTKRTVYNKGLPGGGCASMLYLLRKPEFKKEIPNAEYFIYTYIPEHLRRVYTNSPEWFNEYLFAAYKMLPDGKLKEVKLNNFKLRLASTASYKLFHNYYSRLRVSAFNNDFKLFFTVVKESVNLIREQYPDSKFVILVFDNYKGNDYPFSLEEEEALFNKFAEENNVKVLYTKKMNKGEDLLNGKYNGADGFHPSGEAWKIIVPQLSKELKL